MCFCNSQGARNQFWAFFLFTAAVLLSTVSIPTNNSKLKGVNFVAPVVELKNDAFSPVKRINATWVALNPFAFSSSGNPNVKYNTSRQWWGETKEGVIACIQLARKNGLKIFLKPHVWVLEDGWAGDFEMKSERDWKKWESDYEKYILDYARLADSMNVELFSVGVEYKKAVQLRNTFWKELIAKVRLVFKGKLTYASNWDEYQQINFWDKLDFIGIDAYFQLSEENTPVVAEMKKNWKNTVQEMDAFQKKWKKKILFTEYGYRSIDKCAWKQWQLPDDYNYKGKANLAAQVNAYEALYQTFWGQPWFAGGFIWKWYPEDAIAGGANNNDYTPQNKPAEQTIYTWYSKVY